ncbi:hypothetical protein ACFL0U_02475 [Pseudomonadota bacterium]
MKRFIVLSLLVVFTFGCVGPSAGRIPTGREKNPDMKISYVEQGAFFSGKEKLNYQDFADKRCKNNGSSGYRAYKYSAWMSGWCLGIYPFAIPFTDVTRSGKVWCK